jgi:uncharacterized protein YjbJ (UPF0337 family)
MNSGDIQEQWLRIKGRLKSMWRKPTGDDIKNISGRKGQLLGKLQERYGTLKHEAEQQVEEWLAKLPPPRKR